MYINNIHVCCEPVFRLTSTHTMTSHAGTSNSRGTFHFFFIATLQLTISRDLRCKVMNLIAYGHRSLHWIHRPERTLGNDNKIFSLAHLEMSSNQHYMTLFEDSIRTHQHLLAFCLHISWWNLRVASHIGSVHHRHIFSPPHPPRPHPPMMLHGPLYEISIFHATYFLGRSM